MRMVFIPGALIGEQSINKKHIGSNFDDFLKEEGIDIMPKQTIDIPITEFKIDESESGDIELIYTPNQTQTLYRNQPYRFVFSADKIILEKIIKCPNCGNEIDPDVCYCGTLKESHNDMQLGHVFVPVGCDCGRSDLLILRTGNKKELVSHK